MPLASVIILLTNLQFRELEPRESDRNELTDSFHDNISSNTEKHITIKYIDELICVHHTFDQGSPSTHHALHQYHLITVPMWYGTRWCSILSINMA